MPGVSVIVPAWNAGEDLDRCLQAIKASDYPVRECIVVDDASSHEGTERVARKYGARYVRMAARGGPAVARNRGAREASGEILFFTDADVLLHPDAIGIAVAALQADPDVAAVIGSYDDQPADRHLLSRYRNLYHHWNHQIAAGEASTFWTGCGAMRRDVFVAAGGFSENYRRPSIEDIELGYRLRGAGHRIRLLRNMQCTHLKRWTLGDMVKTDVLRRGVPWVVLLRRFPGVPPDLNLNRGARVATVLAVLFVLTALLLLPGHPASLPLWPGALLPLLCLAGIAWIQRDFLRLLTRLHGPLYALAAVPLQLLFFISCGVSVPLGFIAHLLGVGPGVRKT